MGQKTDKIFERAKAYLNKDNHEQALRLFNQVLNREPSHPEALRNKALIKLLNGTKKETEEFLLFAIKQHPEDDQLYQLLGTYYYNNEAPLKALSQFKKSVEINKYNALSHKGLGNLYANFLNEHGRAIHHFSKAIDLEKRSADIFFNRGCSHMILQEMEKAEQDLRKAAKMDHSNAQKMVKKYFS